jgi:hypothetical protein
MPPGSAIPSNLADAIAIDIIAINNDVADVDANAEQDALVLRNIRISFDHAALDIDGATHRFNNTWKLDQSSITGQLHHPSVILSNVRID